jgi:hypothetical protein
MNDPVALAKFLRDLERLAAGQMILRFNVNERINRYARVLTVIEQGKTLSAVDSPLQLTDAEKQEILKVLNGDLYLEAKIRLYVLLRLDSELSKGQATYNYPTISVEHVLPQIDVTPENDSREILTQALMNCTSS